MNLPHFKLSPTTRVPFTSAPFLSTQKHSLSVHCFDTKNPSSSHLGVNRPGTGRGTPDINKVGTFSISLVHGGSTIKKSNK